MQYAFQQRASDIHIEPRRDIGFVRFRIDGVLFEMMNPPRKMHAALTSRIKIMARMDIAERRRAQDGRDGYAGDRHGILKGKEQAPTSLLVGVEIRNILAIEKNLSRRD
ncbi:MAG: Flp pilus assembly complex ATPase component TadA, partial [Psychrosphaera sp.]|nr:Flp pilus assembly complex ATPase component TadA [Psychrosphaera sp.]